MLIYQIRPVLDPLLRFNRNGLRQNRKTVSQILALRRLIEGIQQNNLTAAVTFIFFKKAFDTIHRAKMIKILTAYEIPQRIVQAVNVMYCSTGAKIISLDRHTEQFMILAGVLQVDTLAPYLSIMLLDYALQHTIAGRQKELGFTITPRLSHRVHPMMLTDLHFADNIALISDGMVQAQEPLSRVETECAKGRLIYV